MNEVKKNPEVTKIIISIIAPAIAVVLMIAVKFYETWFDADFSELGLYPLKKSGLIGVFTMPFLHENWGHLWSNTLPFFVMGSGIVYYFKKSSVWILIFFMVFTGIFTWLIGREAYHIGASGMVYSMSFFILVSAIIKKERRLMAFALLVIFLYGSIIWGFFPQFFPEKNISWEGHLAGAISGILAAFIFKEKGPKEKVFVWEDEDEILETTLNNLDDKENNNISDQYYKFQNRS